MTTATDMAISLSDLLDRWRGREGISGATRARERWQTGLVIAHFDGERPARSLSRAELAEWVGLISASLASSSARVTIGFLRSALEHGSLVGLLDRNVALGLKASKPDANGGSHER